MSAAKCFFFVMLGLLIPAHVVSSHSCDWTSASFITERGQFPEFDVPVHSNVTDSLSCDVVVCVDTEGKATQSYVIRTSGNRAIDLTAVRHSSDIVFPSIVEDKSRSRFALFRLHVTPEYHGSTLTGWLEERVEQLSDTSHVSFALKRVQEVIQLTTSVPESSDEFRPVDFPARLRQQLTILVDSSHQVDIPVWIQALIDTSGQILEATVSKSSGDTYNDSLALLGSLSVGFEPAIAGGHYVEHGVTFKVDFEHDTSAVDKDFALLNQKTVYSENFDKYTLSRLKAFADSVTADSTYLEAVKVRIRTSLMEEGDSQHVWLTALFDHRGKVRDSRIDSSKVDRRFRDMIDMMRKNRTFEPSRKNGVPIPAWRRMAITIVHNEDDTKNSKMYLESALLDDEIWARASEEEFCTSHTIATECATIKDFGEGPDLSALRTDSSVLLVIELCVDSAGDIQDSRLLHSTGREVDSVVESYLHRLKISPALAGEIPVSSRLVIGAQLMADVARPLYEKSGKRVFRFRSHVLEVMRFEAWNSSRTACVPYGIETVAGVGMLARPDLVAQKIAVKPGNQFEDSVPVITYWEPPSIAASKVFKKGGYLMSTVWILALIDTTGIVTDVRVDETSSITTFDSLAVVMAWKNRYRPAYKDGKPIKVWLRYDVFFDPYQGKVASSRLGQIQSWKW